MGVSSPYRNYTHHCLRERTSNNQALWFWPFTVHELSISQLREEYVLEFYNIEWCNILFFSLVTPLKGNSWDSLLTVAFILMVCCKLQWTHVEVGIRQRLFLATGCFQKPVSLFVSKPVKIRTEDVKIFPRNLSRTLHPFLLLGKSYKTNGEYVTLFNYQPLCFSYVQSIKWAEN